jgi:hypothetical protein
MSHPTEKQRPFWFYIYGFNFTINSSLFSNLFGRLLDTWQSFLAIGLGADWISVNAAHPVNGLSILANCGLGNNNFNR